MPTAILVDGGFFLKRFHHVYPSHDKTDPNLVAETMHKMALDHLYVHGKRLRSLYRVFFYDCPPLSKKMHNPVDKKFIDFSKTPQAVFRNALHERIRCLRKTALRLGRLDEENASWMLRDGLLKKLLSGKVQFHELHSNDVTFYARQKVVDMKIGLDIASLAYKRQVDHIVLVAGDSDFVPAAKLARREGIDFILDPMWHTIKPDLTEHIDGLRSTAPRPSGMRKRQVEPATDEVLPDGDTSEEVRDSVS